MSDPFVDAQVQEPDIATFKLPLHQVIITLRHHIVYSPTYQVPVLYFDAYFTDGSRLTLDELYTHVIPPIYQSDLRQSALSMQGAITQADHPFLARPYWYIHPCDTQNLLKTMGIGNNKKEYIKGWLSCVGPLVRCPLSLKLFSQTESLLK
ncbi:autophagocytosis associated protein [Chlamydoabsidia padenii]|nr:autophagocytosis associated protein [Chlamydoabsidia padenii]